MGGMKDLFGDQLYTPGGMPKSSVDGKKARDAGLERVWENAGPYKYQALQIVFDLPRGWIGTGEDVRHLVIAKIGPAYDYHFWGALTREVKKRGWLVPTGNRVTPKDKASHARPIDEYRRT